MPGRGAGGGAVGLPGPPWQFILRAVCVISGLTLLLVVDVRGLVFYIAWSLIALGLLSEALSTYVHWLRQRRARRS